MARTYRPGNHHATCTVLRGKSQTGKSGFIRLCFPEEFQQEWYHDGIKLTDDVKSYFYSLGPVVFPEWGEMVKREKDANQIKQRLTSDVIVTDLKHVGTRSYPVRHVVWGSSNNDDPLPADESGNLRFMVLDTEIPSYQSLEEFMIANRNQIWAQAKHYYENHPRQTHVSQIPDHIVRQQLIDNRGRGFSNSALDDILFQALQPMLNKAKPFQLHQVLKCVSDYLNNERENPADKQLELATRSHHQIKNFLRAQGCHQYSGRQRDYHGESTNNRGSYWHPTTDKDECPFCPAKSSVDTSQKPDIMYQPGEAKPDMMAPASRLDQYGNPKPRVLEEAEEIVDIAKLLNTSGV